LRIVESVIAYKIPLGGSSHMVKVGV